MMTLGTLRYLSEEGLTCPNDLAIIGFGNMPWGEILSPALTFVTQPTYEMGKLAVEQLVSQMDSLGDSHPSLITLPCGFNHRGSCGCQGTRAHSANDQI